MSTFISMASEVKPSSGSVGSASGGSSVSAIQALQKKLVSLQNDLKEAISTPTKEGQAKAKLIQLQITATQAQLDQLIQQKAKEAAEKQTPNKPEQNQNIGKNNNVLSAHKKSIIDEYV